MIYSNECTKEAGCSFSLLLFPAAPYFPERESLIKFRGSSWQQQHLLERVLSLDFLDFGFFGFWNFLEIGQGNNQIMRITQLPPYLCRLEVGAYLGALHISIPFIRSVVVNAYYIFVT